MHAGLVAEAAVDVLAVYFHRDLLVPADIRSRFVEE
jgi:hypothetical protein